MLLNGVIPVNKPRGFTSFDVIAKMRGILKMKKLGHSGTLDPMAEGVLPVFLGSAAKAISLLPQNRKVYKAGFKLGLSSDTQDITGKVLPQSQADVSFQQLERTLPKFKGETSQLPPMYSAVSVNGKRLYEYARQGIEVERRARKIFISDISLLEYDEKSAEGTLRISCSEGTYVRTVIHDMGQQLGCGGVMTSLVRESSNGFDLDQCVTLEQLEELRDGGELEKVVIPTERLFFRLPEIHLSEQKTRMYQNGVKLHLDRLSVLPDWEKFRVYSNSHEFLGLALADRENNELRVLKNLPSQSTGKNIRKTSAALGIFDGIHAGHRLILNKALSYEGFEPAVFTFITETIRVKRGKPFEYISSNCRKLDFIKNEYGFKYIESFNFESLRNLSGEEFVRDILVGKMNVGAVVCGENFRFGRGASCSAGDLREFGEKYGFEVEVITLEMKADNPVSSELIREHLRRGAVSELHEKLGFYYRIENEVTEGNRIGRTLGFPTINQSFGERQLVPKFGVYRTRTVIDGETYDCVTNIGMKPTVGGAAKPLAETHILGYSGDLYGRKIEITFGGFIREERKFGSLEELKKQIEADIKQVRGERNDS